MLVIESQPLNYSNQDEEENHSSKALILDTLDTDTYRLKKFLKTLNFNVILADFDEDIFCLIKNQRPDVIFFNPKVSIDSYEESLEKIKQCEDEEEQAYKPYNILTFDKDAAIGADVLEHVHNYDDICKKPYTEVSIRLKVNTWKKLKEMQSVLNAKTQKVNEYSNQINQEMELASNIINNLIRNNSLSPGNVKYSQFPMEVLSGDIFLSTFNPQGNQVLLIGDLTGHGLAAAVGAMAVYDIFYTMVHKGFGLEDVTKEINKKLRRIQNTGRFMCACLIELDIQNSFAHVYNAGLPDVLFKGKQDGIKHKVKSSNLPLGVINSDDMELIIERFELQQEDKIYIYTDGLNEVANSEGEYLGNQRIHDLFYDPKENDNLYDSILNLVYSFSRGAKRTDDITLVEVVCDETLINKEKSLGTAQLTKTPMQWSIGFDMSSTLLKQENPLPLIIQTITELQGLRIYREHIYTILAEMYSNALEHGLLGLDSSLKNDASGFARYYGLREERLKLLEQGQLQLQIKHDAYAENSGKLTLILKHNGEGFDFESYLNKLDNEENHQQHGRGIKLIRNICDDIRYSDDGRCLEVDYIWKN